MLTNLRLLFVFTTIMAQKYRYTLQIPQRFVQNFQGKRKKAIDKKEKRQTNPQGVLFAACKICCLIGGNLYNHHKT